MPFKRTLVILKKMILQKFVFIIYKFLKIFLNKITNNEKF